MNILITGSSGLIGTALTNFLSLKGHKVFKMQRGESVEVPFYWQPTETKIKFDPSICIDAVINLAGASIAEGRWNEKKKKLILESRETGTKLLSTTLAKLGNRPKVLISGSAIGIYGDTGEKTVDENSATGSGFLAEVCKKWEKATLPATEGGIRTVLIRTGIVLSKEGGALGKMLLPFKAGLGGVTGTGQQYMSWISIRNFKI